MINEWYIPISIIPSIALLLNSTTSLTLGITDELYKKQNDYRKHKHIIHAKLKQVKLLSATSVILYISLCVLVATVLLSGLGIALPVHTDIGMLVAISLFFCAIVLMIIFSINAYTIRQRQFKTDLIEKINQQDRTE